MAESGRSVTVGEVLAEYRTQHLSTLRRRAEREGGGSIRNHVDPHFGDRVAHHLRPRDFFEFGRLKLEGLDEIEEGLASVKFAVVRNALSVLRGALKWYWEEHELDPATCPGRHVTRQIAQIRKRFEIVPRRRGAYSMDQLAQVLEVARDQDQIVFEFYALGAGVGLRFGEILGLEWDHIDWAGGRLTPVRQIDDRRRPTLLKNSKAAEPRQVPVGVMRQLARRRMKSVSERWCFTDCDGLPYLPRTMQYRIMAVRKRAFELHEVPLELSFHSTRHTFVSEAVSKGWDWESLRQQLAHSSAKTTSESYTHPVERDLPAIVIPLISEAT